MDQSIVAAVGGFLIVIIVLSIVFLVLEIIAGWKIYKKAGEKGWKVLIPFYNGYVLYRFIWKTSIFWIMLILTIIASVTYSLSAGSTTITVPLIISAIADVILVVLYIMSLYRLCKCFGHGAGWTIGMIFLPIIFTLMLAFGKSEYKGNIFQKA